MVTALVWRVPKPADLVKHSEHLLSSYVHYQSDRPWLPTKSKNWYDVVWYTTEGSTYFSDSLNKEVAADILRDRGLLLEFYTKKQQHPYTLDNGERAIPTYGLFVGGREVQSLATALAHERNWARLGLPLLGALMISVGFMAFRQDTRRVRELHLTKRCSRPPTDEKIST